MAKSRKSGARKHAGHALRHGTESGHAVESKQRDLHTTIALNEALDKNDDDQLRKLARARGCVNDRVRARAWLRLLHITDDDVLCEREYAVLCQGKNRDSSTIAVDVERSLWHFCHGCTESEMLSRRAALRRVLEATVNAHAGDVHYYQGLHDVASVLLLVLRDERRACCALMKLSRTHLRDSTRDTLDAVVESLQLLPRLIDVADPQLGRHILQAAVLPIYALSWHITWFSHNVRDLATAARLFDLFIASHPLMPLYVGAVAMMSARAQLLRRHEMPELHSALTNLNITARLSTDELCQRAVLLFKAHPPSSLLAASGLKMVFAVAPEASLDNNGEWKFPDKPKEGTQRGTLQRSLLAILLSPRRHYGGRSLPQWLRTVPAVATGVAVLSIAAFVTWQQKTGQL